jgi:hypothetical protein
MDNETRACLKQVSENFDTLTELAREHFVAISMLRAGLEALRQASPEADFVRFAMEDAAKNCASGPEVRALMDCVKRCSPE